MEGTISKIGEVQTFESGFAKIEFVVTTEEMYPQEVKFAPRPRPAARVFRRGFRRGFRGIVRRSNQHSLP